MVSLKIKTLGAVAILLGIFFVPVHSYALDQLGGDDITVETVPENPQPYQDVTINLSSYSTDLNKALIQWQSGPATVLSGYGKTSFSFTAPGPDTVTLFTITITPSDGSNSVVKKIAINPSEVTLLWQSVDGYTPPFYRGKSFTSPEGTIRVVAIPNTNTIKSGKGSITYTWTAGDDNDTIQDASGYNKDSYTFKNDVLHSQENVGVTASSVSGNYNATSTIQVPIASPQLIFYKKSPTEGILYNEAYTTDMPMPEDEATIVAVPYFLALKGNEDAFTYGWKINGNDIDTPSGKTELTIQPTAHGGFATIDVDFENANALFQKVTGELKLDL